MPLINEMVTSPLYFALMNINRGHCQKGEYLSSAGYLRQNNEDYVDFILLNVNYTNHSIKLPRFIKVKQDECVLSYHWFLWWSSFSEHRRADGLTQRQMVLHLGSGLHQAQWCWWHLALASHISLPPEGIPWEHCHWYPAGRSGESLCHLLEVHLHGP